MRNKANIIQTENLLERQIASNEILRLFAGINCCCDECKQKDREEECLQKNLEYIPVNLLHLSCKVV